MNNYKSKLFSILGDSVSTLSLHSEPQDAVFYEGENKLLSNVYAPIDTWWGQVIEALEGEILVNNSFSGSMVCKHKKCAIPSYGCSDERVGALSKKGISPDVIMVYMGTNDWGHGVKLYPNTEEQNDISIFYVAYDEMIKKLRCNYPEAEIWCFTLAISNTKQSKGVDFPYCFGGVHIEKYCEIIKEVSIKHNCKLIDLYKNDKHFDTFDGFHPNKDGMKIIADTVLTQLANSDKM